MSAAIAMALSPAHHDGPTLVGDLSKTSSAAPSSMAAPTHSPSAHRTTSTAKTLASFTAAPRAITQRNNSGSPKNGAPPKSSPPSASRTTPKIFVKKEPSSPDIPNARHRPRKLDLSKNSGPVGNRPLTARDSAGLGIQEVGIACLSPGFVTQDPVMKEQLQRSLSVREHQRQIIEQRLQQQSSKCDGPDHSKYKDTAGHPFMAKTPGLARKRGAPPGLSIVAPSHEQFANERVIQSAPLGQTFTGRHNQPMTRHVQNQQANLASTSHIHHVPAIQTNNRLPPLADVFGRAGQASEPGSHGLHPPQSRAPITSPGHAPLPPQAPTPGRLREYKSAEEAQADLTGGRSELLPKLVHYGSSHSASAAPGKVHPQHHQPPTPPSPHPGPQTRHQHHGYADVAASRSASGAYNGRRRARAEYEEGGSPPLGNGRAAIMRAPFGDGRDSPETQRAKREEFLRLCERAWDLFHS